MNSRKKWIRAYVIGFIVYAAAIGIYLWVDAVQPLPAADRGTAVDPSVFLPAEQYNEMRMYSALKNWLFFISYPWIWGVYLFLLIGGTASRWSARYKLPAFVMLLLAVVFACRLPISLLSFGLSRYYGVSVQSIGGWVRDAAVDFAIDCIITLAVLWTALWVIGRVKRWWLALWLLSVPFTVFLMYIQPVVIDPLFNRYSELSGPHLEEQILKLADRAGIPAERVYEVNISEKTNSLNAYVTGIGPTLRIVLWDTTLRALNEREILFIMAHEIGHYAMHHLEWSALGAVGSSFILLFIGGKLYQAIVGRYGVAIGIRRLNDKASLPLLLLLVSVLSFASAPVSNAVSRSAEHAADVYALEMIGSGEGAVGMYQKLAASSLSDIDPPALVTWFRSTHPSIKERILYVEQFR
ncbi:M48 family metallopeptidase [Paenibacillus thermotolerans]|uniref:M48 family metallopeptidase n=1 Tax=Paenibacillus thermotolerans TaxID=3027807 RepID=UPI002368EE94|nr:MULTISPECIES: M48 family metallopeptidase [unclassified Paenibacillus]